MFPNERIKKYYQQCSEILNFAGVSWWIIDLEDNPDAFYCNDTMCRTFHLDPNKTQHSVSKTCPIAGDYNKFIAINNNKKAQKVFDDYRDLRLNTLNEYCNSFPYYDEHQDKVLFFSSRAKALIRDKEGRATLLFGIIEPETANELLYLKASTDSLTGLKNRREFDSQLMFLMNLAKREKRFVSLILCDIDHFKAYNDLFGHYAGDECLITIANSIASSSSRSTDVVCRYGGEEFAVISYGDAEEVAVLAEKIRTDIEQLRIPSSHDNDGGIVTISTGYVSLIPSESTTTKYLIEKADCGLYLAKERGRNQSAECKG
ncbi:GGDEF domain-containing protein [Vibrio profundi]|uniref:GGDEF domain-containing protein n=1 Tax=Vibrio profundi TaxID=1774960 RepID=UPI0037363690